MTYKFVIKGLMPSLNDYINAERRNRYEAAKMKRQTEAVVIAAVKKYLFGVRLSEPVKIRYLWVEKNKRRDLDNIAFAKKFIQDGLVKAGVIENDGQAYIKGFTDEFGLDRNNPRVEVVIEKIGE